MTTEEKAKRFDEVVDEFRGLLEGVHEDKCDIMEEDILKIVPELKKESEDEKVKRILHSISSKMSFHLPDIFTEEEFQCFDTWSNAWLERQGRKESDPRYENLEELLAADDIYQMAMNDAMVNEAKEKAVNALSEMCIWRLLGLEKQGKNNIGISETTKKELEDNLNKALEKETPESWNKFLDEQGDQKSINDTDEEIVEAVKDISVLDLVEPKFKVGDWICNDYVVCHIVSIENDTYYFDEGDGLSISFVDANYHLWTLKDAKDGDVLASNNGNTFIYHKHDNNYVYYHCSINYFDNITINSSWNVLGIKPATQEQRDLLFQKMHETGYECDAEKKELKKVEQKPAWSEEDERMCNASIRACQYMIENFENSTWDYEDAIDWLKSLKNKVQPKQEWSEEDKGNLLDVKCIIDEIWHCQYVRGEIDRSCEELESLWSWLDDIWQKVEYPSSTWKPSEEQIRALEYQVNSTCKGSWQYKASKELLEQLKKL